MSKPTAVFDTGVNQSCLLCREFYYIQMEKYARQALSEGAKSDSELHVNEDSELYRVLNVHYNRNNHIEVRYTVLIIIRI